MTDPALHIVFHFQSHSLREDTFLSFPLGHNLHSHKLLCWGVFEPFVVAPFLKKKTKQLKSSSCWPMQCCAVAKAPPGLKRGHKCQFPHEPSHQHLLTPTFLLVFLPTNQQTQMQVKHDITFYNEDQFSHQARFACLIKGVDKMQHGLQLWDKSAVLSGANRYERYLSFSYDNLCYSWAKQRIHMRGKVMSPCHLYQTGASRTTFLPFTTCFQSSGLSWVLI